MVRDLRNASRKRLFFARGLFFRSRFFDDFWDDFRRLDPARRNARREDHRIGLFGRQIEAFQNAWLTDAFAILGFEPAANVIADKTGEIFQRLYVLFAKRDEHRQCKAGHLS